MLILRQRTRYAAFLVPLLALVAAAMPGCGFFDAIANSWVDPCSPDGAGGDGAGGDQGAGGDNSSADVGVVAGGSDVGTGVGTGVRDVRR